MKWSWKARVFFSSLLLFGILGFAGESVSISVSGEDKLASALEEALALRKQGVTVTVSLAPGKYRVPLHLDGEGVPPGVRVGELTVRAEIPESVFFTEGILLPHWKPDTFRTRRHLVSWGSPNLRRHFLFMNGAWLTQEWVRERLDPWEYWISQQDGSVLLATPDAEATPLNSVVAASRKSESTLLIQNMSNLVLEGLVFEYDFAPEGGGFLSTPHITDSRNLVFRDCSFLRNQVGLRVLNASDLFFENCRFQYSAEQGLVFSESQNVTLTDVIISHNGHLEPEARSNLAFGFALVLRAHSGSFSLRRSQVKNNPGGIFIHNSGQSLLSLQDVILGYQSDFGISLVGGSPEFLMQGCRLGRNGGTGILVDLGEIPRASPPVQIVDCILFADQGGPLLDIQSGRVLLSDSIMESRSVDQDLLVLSNAGEFKGSRNLYFHRRRPDTAFNGASFPQWADNEFPENGSRFADPLFLDTESLDFDLSFKSPWFQGEPRE